MPKDQVVAVILAFARHLEPEGSTASETEIARERNWIDSAGRPTQEGEDLVAALEEQGQTRSVFRTVL